MVLESRQEPTRASQPPARASQKQFQVLRPANVTHVMVSSQSQPAPARASQSHPEAVRASRGQPEQSKLQADQDFIENVKNSLIWECFPQCFWRADQSQPGASQIQPEATGASQSQPKQARASQSKPEPARASKIQCKKFAFHSTQTV